ncbi:MFS general substrate transporter [Tilletiaria anomala UBC 951]|uniref:MFS general substrate transporter n=1 Tax=Tilletiaria anomala (strain ATCC 24038 / CBS 436.72 / UBC 951) TaxID=1037660 RepID=A0A066W8X7_TILAU|nr:MFS general substrate transporter [Tilletiaria anomala UBC 951]KDN50397.1 MFS general substrate transporter [Tilletiaria anomala UBC 951]
MTDAGSPVKRKWNEVNKVGLIFACGTALFSDGYVNAISGSVNTILKNHIYANYDEAKLKHFSSSFSSVAFAGTVIGMLTFGVLADVVGRKFGMIFASLWLTLWSILAAGAWGANGNTGGLFAALIAYRFLIGIGIGAEYPAGSVAASENTEAEGVSKKRQQMYFSLATNTAIDWGFVVASFVPLVLLWICGTSTHGLTIVWRLSLGLGAIPPLAVLLFRTRMQEPTSYQKNKISWKKLPWGLVLKRYWLRFTAVCLAWWCYDWVSYPAGIYSSLIAEQLVPGTGAETLYATFGWSTLINFFYVIGTMVGAIFIIDRLGPKNTMIFGLVMQAAFAFGLAGGYAYLSRHIGGFVVVYGLFLAFGEIGPGNCLGLLASKAVAPTAIRGVAYGVAAAIGKIGAFVGTYVFNEIQADFAAYPNGEVLQYSGTFYISGVLALFSAVIVYFFIPPVVPDGMKKEDEAFIAYLEQHGYSARELGLVPDEDPDAVEKANGDNIGSEDGDAKQESIEKHDDEQPDAIRTSTVELKA